MADHSEPVYLIYDRATGTVLGSYSVVDPETGKYSPQSLDDIKEEFQKTNRADAAVGGVAREIDVLETDGALENKDGAQNVRSGRWVDVKNRRVMPRYDLKLEADRKTIKGDGKDTAEVTISVTDQKGKVVKDFEGELRVTTTHGRLSTSGGRVKARGGKATVALTSTIETINRVSISATDEARRCNAGTVDLEFL